MGKVSPAEEGEGRPVISHGASDAFGFGIRIIVYKRQNGDRLGSDLRQCLVMPLDELLRHNCRGQGCEVLCHGWD